MVGDGKEKKMVKRSEPCLGAVMEDTRYFRHKVYQLGRRCLSSLWMPAKGFFRTWTKSYGDERGARNHRIKQGGSSNSFGV